MNHLPGRTSWAASLSWIACSGSLLWSDSTNHKHTHCLVNKFSTLSSVYLDDFSVAGSLQTVIFIKTKYVHPQSMAVFPVTSVDNAHKRICPVAERTRRTNNTSHSKTTVQWAQCTRVRKYFRLTVKSSIWGASQSFILLKNIAMR